MKTIYLDNFRGFSDTYINLEKVNFFVGENSTGKSSVISIIKLLSTSEFWFNNSFDYLDQINFTHFQDVVSVHASDKKHFNIGHINDNDGKITAFFISFKSVEGLPKPELFYYYCDGEEIKVRLSNTSGKYKICEILQYQSVEECKKNIFKTWVETYKTDTRGYKVLPHQTHTLPLDFLISFIKVVEINGLKNKMRVANKSLFFTEDVVWMAPIRTMPKRTYDEYKYDFSPEGSHTPYIIKKILDKKNDAIKFRNFLEDIGRDSRLFKSVNITKFGKHATAPFEVDIILDEKKLGINNVGYGVSQILPVLVESFVRENESWFAIQQPEVHLHPKAQASLGDMFYKLSIEEHKNFIIETHSDYTIDRFRINCKKDKNLKENSAQIIYFERVDSINTVHHLAIDKDGNLPTKQPKSYRAFYVKEELALLGY